MKKLKLRKIISVIMTIIYMMGTITTIAYVDPVYAKSSSSKSSSSKSSSSKSSSSKSSSSKSSSSKSSSSKSSSSKSSSSKSSSSKSSSGKSSSSKSSSSKSSSSKSSSSKPSSKNQSSSKNNVSNKSSNYKASRGTTVKTGTYRSTSKTNSTSKSTSSRNTHKTSNVKYKTSNPFKGVTNKIRGSVSKAKKNITNKINRVTNKVKDNTSKLSRRINTKIKKVTNLTKKVTTNIRNNTSGIIKKVGNKLTKATNNVKRGIKNTVKNVSNKVKSSLAKIPKTVQSVINNGKSKIKQVTHSIKTNVTKGIKAASTQVKKTIAKTKVAINNSLQKVKDTTKMASTLFRNGVNNVKNVAKDIGSKTVKTVTKALDSKVGRIVTGTLQTVGGALQVATGTALCSTGVGAIIGAPLILHGTADVVQGLGNTYYAATDSKKTMCNFMEEGYKFAGRGIGGLIGGEAGAAKGEKIASGVFLVADLAMGLVNGKAVLDVAKTANKGAGFINGTKKVLMSYGDETLKGAKGIFKTIKEIPTVSKNIVKGVPENINLISKKFGNIINDTSKVKAKVLAKVDDVKDIAKTFSPTYKQIPNTDINKIVSANNGQRLQYDLQFFANKAEDIAKAETNTTSGMKQKVLDNLAESKAARGASEFDKYLVEEKKILEDTASKVTTEVSDVAKDVINTGRNKNKLKPDSAANGNAHSTFKRDAVTGEVTNYETYSPNPKNPKTGLDVVKRYDGMGDAHFNKVTKQYVDTPHVHTDDTIGGVRSATIEEIPKKP